MSLDLVTSRESFNTTHNHAPLARELGIYDLLWNARLADGKPLRTLGQLRQPLAEALERIDRDRNSLQVFNSLNGWGSVDAFETFLVRVLAAATVRPRLPVQVCA